MPERENKGPEDSNPGPLERSEEIGNSPEKEITEPISVYSQTSTEQMEVHHHPDLHHKKKKLREYFLEFIMIFLAVTLGFFAESLREHMSETTRAKDYAQMLLKDIIKDTSELHQTMERYQLFILTIDTLQQLRRSKKYKMTDVDVYWYSWPAFRAGRISFNDATLQQVKNSGNLRYFHSLALKEKIDDYDNSVRNFSLRMEIELNWVLVLNEFNNNLFDYDVRDIIDEKESQGYSLDSLQKDHYVFLKKDPAEISRFFNFCTYRKFIWRTRIRDNIIPTLEIARQLIAMFKNEYSILDSK